MNRKLLVAVLALTSLVTATPVFAHDWDGASWSRHERFEAAHRRVERERARLRHEQFVHQRYAVHNERAIVRDRAPLHRERW